MNSGQKKSLLVIVRHTPYGSSLARSSLEIALSSASFEQTVGLLFMGQGVLQLLSGQDSRSTGVRNISKLISSFPLYELDNIYVDKASLEQYGLAPDELALAVNALDDDAMHELIVQYDHIVGM